MCHSFSPSHTQGEGVIQEQGSPGVTLEFCLSQSLLWQVSLEEMAPLSQRPSLKKFVGVSCWEPMPGAAWGGGMLAGKGHQGQAIMASRCV